MNRNIRIATGKSRTTARWHNIEVQWSDLVKKTEKTTRTSETFAQYQSMTKDEKSNAKDVGGFIGGYLTNGSRKAGACELRSIVTLDMDYGDMKAWDKWKALGYESFCYSTHSHTAKKPRLRIVVLLKEDITADEYEPLARMIAKKIGIELFDDTTYEITRLMFWPSTATDGEYFFDRSEGAALDGKQWLETEYHNWHDISEWPLSSRVQDVNRREAKAQEDPREKSGVIGLFCRAYSIEDCIETFLSDKYEETSNGRYTYKEGSTANGVVTYDGIFAYSHHATDPAGGHLCNAFDLVRLHLFQGDSKATLEWCSQQDKFKALDAQERRQRIDEDYKAITENIIAPGEKTPKPTTKEEKKKAKQQDNAEKNNLGGEDWALQLEYDKKGAIKNTLSNIEIILENEPCAVKDRVRYNAFADRKEVCADLGWRDKGDRGDWTDRDTVELRTFMEKNYGITAAKGVEDRLLCYFHDHAYHPIKDYLQQTKWDGVKRIDTLLIDYLGADDNEYVRKATRKAFLACVARVFRPGCKFDYVLTLVGPEGQGKSTLLAKMGGQWFSDNFILKEGKESKEQLRGVWILEMSELAGLNKSEVETIKSYISSREDRYRPAFGKEVISFPRQTVFFGTTNEDYFLRAETGNRRFWPVTIHPERIRKSVFDNLTQDEVRQIWAELLQAYKGGEAEELWLGLQIEQEARRAQEKHRIVDEWEPIINEYLDALWPDTWENMTRNERKALFEGLYPDVAKTVRRDKFSVQDIWAEAIGGRAERVGVTEGKRIRAIMRRRNDFEEKLIKAKGLVYRGFVRNVEK